MTRPEEQDTAPVEAGTFTIAHDGFTGTLQGRYTTREGKVGVVLQQLGTRVVHVYGEKWVMDQMPAGPTGEAKTAEPVAWISPYALRSLQKEGIGTYKARSFQDRRKTDVALYDHPADTEALRADVERLTRDADHQCRQRVKEFERANFAERQRNEALARLADAEKRGAEMAEALAGAVSVIDDYLAYTHDGDPWSEDARLMNEMAIDEYGRDGRLDRARALVRVQEGDQ